MSAILDKLADQHEERIINTLYRLEEDVIKEVTKATGGTLDVDTRLAIQLQPRLRAAIENSNVWTRKKINPFRPFNFSYWKNN